MADITGKISMVAVLALAALPALGLAQAARAAPVAAPVRIQVADLDLSRAQDARLFQARVRAAGRAVCDGRARWERLGSTSAMACRLDFNDAVHDRLSPAQAAALRTAGG